MRLQKQVSRKIGDKKYSKWVLVIPSEIIEKASLKEGDDLSVDVDNKKRIVIGIRVKGNE